MTTQYYIISSKDAHILGVTSFRHGNEKKGFVVTVGDMVTASEDIKKSAKPVSESEAIKFIKDL